MLYGRARRSRFRVVQPLLFFRVLAAVQVVDGYFPGVAPGPAAAAVVFVGPESALVLVGPESALVLVGPEQTPLARKWMDLVGRELRLASANQVVAVPVAAALEVGTSTLERCQ